MAEQFVGSGWAFPLRIGATGGIALVAREQELTESIRLILATAPGERPMRPEFGCAIHDHVFAPADEDTAGLIGYEVRRALDRWEPRIDVAEVAVAFDAHERGTLYIDIRYTVRGTNSPRNLVFPFYVIPSHEGTAATADPATPAVPAAGPHAQESAR
ncbi:phage baseplate assembly protein W [Kitasatospora sp. MAA4]|uniref:GPW/gp25 family protein n=1 Tax=Kitasatospora sp. MAA4 TaxID=3035093 RepID=UPI00247540C2|nr:GPW/gp25 family protein [Kitasatospora sp. MAA4]MDH6137747.1 phage baseplate assembly protein W [Kitasatospora sp. MAA4]